MIPGAHVAARFAPGTRVAMVNDYGARFPGKTIVSVDESDFGRDWGPRYFITPSDSPWFSVHEDNLQPELGL